MSMLTELIDFQRQGVELGLTGDDVLKVSFAKGGLSQETKSYLRNHKDTIRDLFKRLEITSSKDIQCCSFAQQRLWLLDRIEPGSGQYNMAMGLRLEGELDGDALRRALDSLVQRHEVLRTVYRADEQGEGVQVVRPSTGVELQAIDLSHETAQVHVDGVARLAQQEALAPFDLSCDPMLRARLVRLSPCSHVLLITLHHIASDGWSMAILTRELGELYEAYAQGRENPLRPLPIQYKDYARWQRQWMQTAMLQRQLAYWKHQLQGLPTVHGLPLDRARPAVAEHGAGQVQQRLGAALYRDLLALANANGATLFMVLHAAFAALLSRHSAERDIVIGTAIANREQAEVAPLVGFFVNTLVLRSDLSADPSFEQLLQQSRQRLLDAYEHQQLPFEKLVDALQPERSLSHTPLFQVMLVLQNNEAHGLQLQGLQVHPLEIASAAAKCDLTLDVQESEDGLRLRWEYATSLFDAATIERMASHFEVMLGAAVKAPHTPVSRLPILSQAERHQLLVQWNDTAAPYPEHACIHELFEAQVARRPQQVALVFEGRQLSYGELNAKANQLARHLRVCGIGPDALVGVCVERSLDMVVALLGILKAGGAYVPLDPTYPAERIEYMLADSRAQLLITQRRLQPALPAMTRPVLCLDDAAQQVQLDAMPSGDLGRAELGLLPSHLAYVIYTSGSTGQPKGVMNEHGAVVNRLHWMQQAFGLCEGDAVLQKTPYGFDVSVWEFFWPLMCGSRLVIARPEGHKEPDYLAQLVDDAAVTTLHFVPSMLQAFVAGCDGWQAASLKRVFCSGEALPPALRDRFVEVWPHVELHNLYGPTEAAVDVTWYPCKADSKRAIVPIGRPIANTQMHILDAHLEPVPIGVPGEVHIGGVQVARGYLHRAELSAQRFIPDPFGSHANARLYKTGDLGRWLPDGNIEYLGRNDFQVKIRGFRIELGEIEAALRDHPDVRDATVIARDEPRRLVAYIVASAGADIEPGLRKQLKQRLPEHMMPAAFVFLKSLPVTPNGKLDRKALPAPDAYGPRNGSSVAPSTPTETQLCGIWEELLGQANVGTTDSFFEIGGHSLLAMRLTAQIAARWGVRLPVRRVFEHDTVRTLAECIDGALPSQPGHDAPLRLMAHPEQGPAAACSFAQQRLWLLDRIEPGSGQYNMAMGLRLEGELDGDALRRALDSLVQRHEVLRTVYRADEQGEGVQVVRPSTGVELQAIDLSHETAQVHVDGVARLAQQEALAPFDLSCDPMLRARLVRLSPCSHVLLITLHHIASDGWSMAILTRELGELYEAYAQGRENPLRPLPIQYKDYARWQRQWMQTAMLQRQLAYWKHQLQGLPTVHGLPLDRARPAVAEHGAGQVQQRLGAALYRDLLALANANGATLFMVLHAAFAALLSRHSAERDIVIGTAIANREQAEVAPLVGFFVNTLVLRSDLSADPSFEQLLQQSRQRLLDAYEHQQLPFEKLVDALQPERSLSHTPLFQVMLVLQNNEAHGLQLQGLQVHPLEIASAAAKCDLTLDVQESEDGLRLRWEYATSLFDAATIERMASHFEVMLGAAVKAPHTPVSRLPILSQAERHQLLVQWNDTAAPYPEHACIHELFEAQVARRPQQVALVFEGRQLSYGELNAKANQLARHLRVCGIGPDALVGVCVERSLDMVVALLGILKAGGAYVPLDPTYPAERIEYMLADSRAQLLITQRRLQPALPAMTRPVLCLDDAAQQVQLDAMPSGDLGRAELGLLPSHLAYVIYTSGSTGQPKGVMNEHGAVVNRLHWMQQAFGLCEGDAVLQKTPYGFDVSVWEFFWPLMCGSRLVIARPEGHKEPDYLAQLVDDAAVTTLHFVPSMLQAFVAGCDGWQAASLKRVFCSGEALPPALRDRFVEVWPHVELHNLYGPTEAAVDVTWYPCKADSKRAIVPIGRPIANTQMHILDAHLEPVPIGVPGEVHIGGVQVARGYLHRAELSAQRFIPDPFGSHANARLYKTGDLGRWLPDGNIEYLGRNDFQVKIRGFRIELGEIEAQLMRCQGIAEAVVVAREDDPGGKRLVAYVVAKQDADASAADARNELSRGLPDYMVPSAIILLPALPLSPNGKLDRSALPAPERAAASGRDDEAPLGDTEVAVSRIWQDLLRLESVSRHDHFFDLGGHSLLALNMLDQLNAQFALSLSANTLFRHQSVAALASCIEEAGGKLQRDPALAIFREGSNELPALLLIHPIGGSPLCYGELLGHLRYRGSVWTCQQTAEILAAERTGTVEGLASLYVSAWVEQAAGESICLLGWSFGGVIAYEMARQFEQRGVEVRWLGLIDSHVRLPALAGRLSHEAIGAFALDLGFGRGDLALLQAQAVGTVDEALQHLLTRGRGQGLLPPAITISELSSRYRMTESNLQRMLAYEPSNWQGRASYYRASAEPTPEADNPIWKWMPLLSGMEVFPIDADHFSIVKGRHAQSLARLVQRALAQGVAA